MILVVIAMGLAGFAIWRLLQATMDADGRGRSAKALVARIGQGISAVVYASLAVFAASLVLASGRGKDGEQSARDWTAWLMTQPFGRWLVGAVGVAIIGTAVGMATKVWTAYLRQHLDCGAAASWVVPLGRAGYAARAVVFLVVGGFLLIAAWQSDPNEARGLGGALLALQKQPYGPVMFALVATGLAAFAIFNFAQARFRRVAAPEPATMVQAAKAPT